MPSRRYKVVTTVAAIKRQTLNDEAARTHIEYILYHKRYHKFHTEFIKETISAHPKVIFEFLEKNIKNFEDTYYQGLYLGLLQQYRPTSYQLTGYINDFLLDNPEIDYTDKRCLYNNICLDSTLSKLANINQIFAYHQLDNIDLIDKQVAFTVINLKPALPLQQKFKKNSEYKLEQPKVTVIMTTYNAIATIDNCIRSLLQQTWSNIEVIIVDDASTDGTLQHLQQLNEKNSVLKVISLPQNVGTFAAKSIGVQYATGEFLTCQDSDDWAHPQKLAEQVQPLIDNPELIATTSYWLRLDYKGQYYVRQIYPFMRQNPASPMFRLQAVKRSMGLWHIVRTGADSEFYERLKIVYGVNRITVIKKPLTIASHRPNSLMTSEESGVYNRTAALARLDYWEAWRLWHIDMIHKKNYLFMLTVQQQIDSTQVLFSGIPNSIKVNKSSLEQSLVVNKALNTIFCIE